MICGKEEQRLKSEVGVGVKLILGWPHHSMHNYGKAIISITELLYSVRFLHGSQETDSTTLRKGRRDCSVTQFITEEARRCFWLTSDISLSFPSLVPGP